MTNRNIIVIGCSAGGFDAVKQLVKDLPSDLDAAIFIVWHMAPDVTGVLPDVINKIGKIGASHAVDKDPIVFNRIYVAPPDRHLILEPNRIRLSRGPKENRFRPAVDPLFRSAAVNFKNRVIGIILSGALADGSAGLLAIKRHGGLAIVQDPNDALVPSMPETAISTVETDYVIGIRDIGGLVAKLAAEEVEEVQSPFAHERDLVEVAIAKDELIPEGFLNGSELSPYTCPECHGVLAMVRDGGLTRFRCHTGHAYSVSSLLSALSERIEESLWNVVRGMEETIFLLNTIGDHHSESNHPKLAALYFKKAKEEHTRAGLVREIILTADESDTDPREQEITNGLDSTSEDS